MLIQGHGVKANLCVLLCSALLLALGCFRSPMDDAEPRRPAQAGTSPTNAPDALAASADAIADRARDSGPDLPRDLGVERGPEVGRDAGNRVCLPGENYILVLGTDENLYRLYPDTLTTVRIGQVRCGTPDQSLNSLTVSPRGPAYISNSDGELCAVELDTFASRPTTFNATAVSNRQYGMAVVPDDVPGGQTLYIAVASTSESTLARVDLASYAITTVGPVVIRRDGGAEARPHVELTAGSNGELYGFSIGPAQSLLLTIDPKTGEAIDVSQVPAGANNAAFALVDWHGTLYIFLGNGDDSLGAFVFTYRKGDTAVSNIGTLDVDILGAGVALCR